jgi:glycine/D-amino acid oxidase-like deaminating enzyme
MKDVKAINEEAEILQKYGLQARFVKEIPELPFPIKAAVKLDHQGEFNSYKYCLGLISELEKRNCQFFEHSRVTDVTFSGSPCHVVSTENESISASHVVVATHLPILDRSGHFCVTSPSKSYCMAFEMKEGTAPRDGYISTGEQLENKSIRSTQDGKVLIVAGCGHTSGEPPSGSTAACYQELERFARDNFKVGDLICYWSGLDYYTADELPYIGYLHHGTDTMYTATGFAKWGFTQGAASGIAISELIVNKTAPTWLTPFDARRWDLAKSTLQGLGYQMHVSKHYAMVPLDRYKGNPDNIASVPLQLLNGGDVRKGFELVQAFGLRLQKEGKLKGEPKK